jgi:hypothetical protein
MKKSIVIVSIFICLISVYAVQASKKLVSQTTNNNYSVIATNTIRIIESKNTTFDFSCVDYAIEMEMINQQISMASSTLANLKIQKQDLKQNLIEARKINAKVCKGQ